MQVKKPAKVYDVLNYDQVDQLIGVNGGDEDLDVLPGSKYHMPPPRPRCGEMLLKNAAARAGIQIVPGRRAVLTRYHNGMPACHYCGHCGEGCDTGSFFNSADHLIPVAQKTGRLEIRSNAVVARILTDKEGRASGAQYFDRHTKREYKVRAKVVALGAPDDGIGGEHIYMPLHAAVQSPRRTQTRLRARLRNAVLGKRMSGGRRMSADPRNSALNGFCQMRAVENLFVVDGSAFPSATEKNPTLTILALAWRATDYLANEMKKGNL